MSGIDKCCVFFKELALRFKVPAQMNVTSEGTVRIHIDRSLVDFDMLNEIQNEARKRGMKVDGTQYWVTIHG